VDRLSRHTGRIAAGPAVPVEIVVGALRGGGRENKNDDAV